MKYEKGFIPVLVAIIVVAVAATGGYFVYKNVQEKKAVTVQQEAVVETDVQATDTEKSVTPSTPTGTKVSTTTTATGCTNYDCLIAAAQTCTPITSTISFTGLPFSFFSMKDTSFTVSGKTQIKIKSGQPCTFETTSLGTTAAITAEGRAALQAKGLTDKVIDENVATVNASLKATANGAAPALTCTGTSAAVAEYFANSKNGVNVKTVASYDLSTKKNQTKLTTSSGLELICTT